MKLTDTISIDEFREEMQHRVVKYPLSSRQVREGMRFAKQHSNPEFFRVALDKVDAQKEFQHERDGLSRLDRLLSVLGGLPREVAVTLFFVVVVLVSLHYSGSWLMAEPNPDAQVDVERLAQRMGFYIKEQHASSTARPLADLDREVSDKIDKGIADANLDDTLTGKLSAVIEQSRFEEVAATKLGERLQQTNLEAVVLEQLGKVLDQPTLKQLVADRVDRHITSAGIKQRVLAEFDAALDETRLTERVAALIDARLKEFDQELANHMTGFQKQLSEELKLTLDRSELDKRIGDRISSQITQLDKRLAEFDQQLLERGTRFQEQIATSLRDVLDGAKIDQQISERIDRQMNELDKHLAKRLASKPIAPSDKSGSE
jgi:hypothetical protein